VEFERLCTILGGQSSNSMEDRIRGLCSAVRPRGVGAESVAVVGSSKLLAQTLGHHSTFMLE
jgi:hypothetical protein